MNNPLFSLPSLSSLPGYVAIDAVVGYVAGRVEGKSDPRLLMTICAIRSVVNTVFYLAVNFSHQTTELHSAKIFLVTSTITNMVFLVALRELRLIGQLSSYLIGVSALGYLIGLAVKIQSEDKSIQSKP